MEIAVTGASGFIGSHVVDAALRKGYKLRILTRKHTNRKDWQEQGVKEYIGDIRDTNSLNPFLDGADALLHVAGVNSPSSNMKEEILSSNVVATENIIRCAVAKNVKKIVYTGSTAARGCRGRGQMNDETVPFNLHNASTDYEISKYLGEEKALELYKSIGAPVVIVEPSASVGPADVKPTYTGKLIIDFITGKLPGYFDIRHNFVDVRSVAEGHILALEKGRLGERYLLCGDDNILLSEFFKMIEEITGKHRGILKVPLFIAFPLAYANYILWKVSGIEPIVRISTVKRAWLDLYFSNQKAKRELAYNPGDLKKALIDEILWFCKNGYLDPKYIANKLE